MRYGKQSCGEEMFYPRRKALVGMKRYFTDVLWKAPVGKHFMGRRDVLRKVFIGGES